MTHNPREDPRYPLLQFQMTLSDIFGKRDNDLHSH